VVELRKQRDAEIAKRNALTNAHTLPAGFLPVLDTLVEAMPPYTRIERLAEAGAVGATAEAAAKTNPKTAANNDDDDAEATTETNTGLVLSGGTRWQAGLGDLVSALGEALRPHGLVVQQDALELAAERRSEQLFTYRIVPLEATP
jgi:hypothetical protein